MPDIFIGPKGHKPVTKHPQDISAESQPTPSATHNRPHRLLKHSLPASHHPRHSMFPLAAYAVDPRGVHFATQGESEEIHLFLRRHIITNVPWIILSALLIVFPLFFPLVSSVFPFTPIVSRNVMVILLSFYYIVVFGAVIFASFINWYFNVYIVTNERVIDVDFINIIYREVSATRLNLIQDVTVKTGGVIRAIFDYGDVFIQTAGTEVNFDFHAVPHPQQVAREIEKLMEGARKKEGASELEEAIER